MPIVFIYYLSHSMEYADFIKKLCRQIIVLKYKHIVHLTLGCDDVKFSCWNEQKNANYILLIRSLLLCPAAHETHEISEEL